MSYKSLLLIALMVVAASAQVPPETYYGRGFTVELTRAGEMVERKIVGIPGDRMLTQDADFALRSRATWRADFYTGKRAVCWLIGEQPTPPPTSVVDLTPANILLDVLLSDYRAAPALGDSLYFLHADPRTKLVDGVQLIQEDSREWGPVHSREFLRIVDE